MAIYDVKYNPSLTPIAGTTHGWYGGVDDDLGYVIYSDTSSTNLAGRPDGRPTFFRSKGKTDAALLELINRIPGNTQSFNNINDAKAWINNIEHFGLMKGSSGTSSSLKLSWDDVTNAESRSCTNLGGTVGNNNVFLGITGKTMTLIVPAALMTCNFGNPDVDIQYLRANNTETIITV